MSAKQAEEEVHPKMMSDRFGVKCWAESSNSNITKYFTYVYLVLLLAQTTVGFLFLLFLADYFHFEVLSMK